MFKKTAPSFALCFAVTVFAAPVSRMHAQLPTPPTPGDVVTGTDPEPTGEPSSNAMPELIGTPSVAVTASIFLR